MSKALKPAQEPYRSRPACQRHEVHTQRVGPAAQTVLEPPQSQWMPDYERIGSGPLGSFVAAGSAHAPLQVVAQSVPGNDPVRLVLVNEGVSGFGERVLQSRASSASEWSPAKGHPGTGTTIVLGAARSCCAVYPPAMTRPPRRLGSRRLVGG